LQILSAATKTKCYKNLWTFDRVITKVERVNFLRQL